MSGSLDVPVVSVAFRKVAQTSNRQQPFRKIGEPILEIEVLGDRHNLKKVGELLFENYLREVLNEELYEHMWTFEPSDTEEYSGMALKVDIPMLSEDMHTYDPFKDTRDDSKSASTPYKIKVGTELRFKYDMGSPTYLMATIVGISPLPEGKTIDSYPAKKADPSEHLVGEKRKRLAELPVLTITMDEAYPSLRHRLLSEHGVRLEIGTGSDPIPNKLEGSAWARIWGGGPNAAYDRSLECSHAFDDMDEAFLCFDRAIQKQTAPGHPTMIREKECKSRTTGEVYRRKKEDKYMDFTVVANVLPAAAPAALYQREMMQDFSMSSHPSKDEDPVLRSWSRYCFNFALEKDWKTKTLPIKQEPDQGKDTVQPEQRVVAPNFNFTKQFPQCAAWLTRPCGTCHWMFLERGVLHAAKGKHNVKTGEKVVHRTLKHTSLHAMFADLEDQLVLPKAWKIKKNA